MQGKCPECLIRFVWMSRVKLKDAACPFCRTPLERTTRLYKGIRLDIDRPWKRIGRRPRRKINRNQNPVVMKSLRKEDYS